MYSLRAARLSSHYSVMPHYLRLSSPAVLVPAHTWVRMAREKDISNTASHLQHQLKQAPGHSVSLQRQTVQERNIHSRITQHPHMTWLLLGICWSSQQSPEPVVSGSSCSACCSPCRAITHTHLPLPPHRALCSHAASSCLNQAIQMNSWLLGQVSLF